MYGASPIEMMATRAMLNGWVFCQKFDYSAVFFGTTALGANGTVNIPIQVTADSDFVIQRVNLTSWSAVGTQIADPDYTLLMTINGSATQLMDQPQTVQNLCGNFTTNHVPSDWTFPYIVPANNTLTVQLVNRTAVAANRVDVTLSGFKVKYLSMPDDKGGVVPTTRTAVFHML